MKTIYLILLPLIIMVFNSVKAKCNTIDNEPKTKFIIVCQNCYIHIHNFTVDITGKRFKTGENELTCVGMEKICQRLIYGDNGVKLEMENEITNSEEVIILDHTGSVIYLFK